MTEARRTRASRIPPNMRCEDLFREKGFRHVPLAVLGDRLRVNASELSGDVAAFSRAVGVDMGNLVFTCAPEGSG